MRIEEDFGLIVNSTLTIFLFFFFTDVEYLKREALAAKLASTSSKTSFCDTTLNFTIVLIYVLNVMIQNVSL